MLAHRCSSAWIEGLVMGHALLAPNNEMTFCTDRYSQQLAVFWRLSYERQRIPRWVLVCDLFEMYALFRKDWKSDVCLFTLRVCGENEVLFSRRRNANNVSHVVSRIYVNRVSRVVTRARGFSTTTMTTTLCRHRGNRRVKWNQRPRSVGEG